MPTRNIRQVKNVPEGKVEFLQYHQPYMESGEYRLKVEQTIEAYGKINSKMFSRQITFVVSGERFVSFVTDRHSRRFSSSQHYRRSF